MDRITSLTYLPPEATHAVVALGNFDGIHKGHQAIIQKTKEIAAAENTASAVMTFEPHPREFFHQHTQFRLTSATQKANLLAELGIDYLFEIAFSEDFAALSATVFIDKILVNSLAASHVVIGHDFIFGKNRSGNHDTLASHAQQRYRITKLDAIGEGHDIFSSSVIRKAIESGDLSKANYMLGRAFSLQGTVMEGKRMGRELGFPTANLALGNHVIPAFGVYAGYVHYQGQALKAAINIGIRPSFSDSNALLEAHILDHTLDLYGKEIEVSLVEYIRQEHRFESLEALKEQIAKDCILIDQRLN